MCDKSSGRSTQANYVLRLLQKAVIFNDCELLFFLIASLFYNDKLMQPISYPFDHNNANTAFVSLWRRHMISKQFIQFLNST